MFSADLCYIQPLNLPKRQRQKTSAVVELRNWSDIESSSSENGEGMLKVAKVKGWKFWSAKGSRQ